MNNCTLIGRICNNIEVRYTQDGMAIARFSIAVDRYTKGEKKADFINILVFGKSAENCEQYLAKGRKVALEGRIQTGNYTKDDGTKVYTTDVVANRVEFIEWGEKKEDDAPPGFEALDEDVPF